MNTEAVQAHREALFIVRERARCAAILIADAHAHWWRPVRALRRRRAARALLAANDASREAMWRAWAAMSPSERAAENARAVRGAVWGAYADYLTDFFTDRLPVGRQAN